MRQIKFRAWDKDNQYMNKWDQVKQWSFDSYEQSSIVLMQYTDIEDESGTPIYEHDILHVIENGDYGGEFLGEVKWLSSWAIYGIQCISIKEISKSKTNDRVDTIFTRGFLTRRYGSCIELSEMFIEPFCNSFEKAEVIGNKFENPELLQE